jgi:hypothetical protein
MVHTESNVLHNLVLPDVLATYNRTLISKAQLQAQSHAVAAGV